MKWKSYNEIMNKTLHQLSVLYSFDEVMSKKEFAILLLNIYFDAIEIEEVEEDRTEALKEIYKPLFTAPKLSPPPGFLERYKNYGK